MTPERWTPADEALAYAADDEFRAQPVNLTPMLDAECVLDPVDRGQTSWRFVLPVLAVIFLVPWALIALVAWVGWLAWGAVR